MHATSEGSSCVPGNISMAVLTSKCALPRNRLVLGRSLVFKAQKRANLSGIVL